MFARADRGLFPASGTKSMASSTLDDAYPQPTALQKMVICVHNVLRKFTGELYVLRQKVFVMDAKISGDCDLC